jgi:hypothetical protein
MQASPLLPCTGLWQVLVAVGSLESPVHTHLGSSHALPRRYAAGEASEA